MKQNKIYSILGLFFILSFLIILLIIKLQPSWKITGDGFGYYSYLRSLYFDHNLDFHNEYKYYDLTFNSHLADIKLTPINKLGNVFAVGLSIVWLPFFLIARILDYWIKTVPGELPGLGINYQISLAVGSILYTLGGSLLLFQTLKKFFSARSAWISVLAIVFISPLPQYLIYEPHMSHGVSLAAVSLMFWLSVKIYQSRETLKYKDLVWLGLSMGLVILLRWQNLIFWLIPLIFLYQQYKKNLVQLSLVALPFILGLLCFIPQLIVWKVLYGSFFTIPQGSGFLHFFNPQIWNFLFSGFHGLFFWHPLLLLGLIGLILSYKRYHTIFGTLLIVLLGQIYINSIVNDWWAGQSFGSRRMIESLPIFAFGLAYLLDYLSNKKILYKSLLVILLLGYLFNISLLVSAPRGYLPLEKPVSLKQFYQAPLQLLQNKLK
ncbi:MAG: hypothetical protein NTU97_02115 [Candidatus Magasanikbacteria bacterium]|nr:hypothetical protein [Candidatus Magasanikbacteria bacterium]